MIGIMLPSSIGGALANLAVLLAGKVPVNLNFTSGKESMALAIEQCRIRTILTSRLFLTKAKLEEIDGMIFLEEIMKEMTPVRKALTALMAALLPTRLLQALCYKGPMDPHALATVIFSSGSTGIPKGVMLTHHNILSNVESFEQVFWLTEEDCVMGVLPFFHSFGFTGTLWLPLLIGFGVVYHPNPLDAKAIGELVAKYKATILISTPTFYAAYIRRCGAEEFATLRYAIVGAEKLREPIAKAFKEKYGIDLLEGYGCTEMGPVVAVNVPDVQEGKERQTGSKFGTVGHPVPGVSVKVVDPESGEPILSDAPGLLLVRGPNQMTGYLGQPDKTNEAFRDGWYVTGDIAAINDDGFIRITDRLSRFSKIGGEMVPHLKVEEAVTTMLGECSCVVTAVPDEQKGERLIVLHTHKEMTAEALWEQLSQSDLPKLWIPKRENFYFIETIPTLGTGKVDLRAVKALALSLIVSAPE